uniref:Poly [ADP-ribose] polymerase n=1 Tax=Strigamia maritima TaxID=126957 RepID=T1IJ17_STRMM
MPPKRKVAANKAGQAAVTKKAKQATDEIVEDETDKDVGEKSNRLYWQWQSDDTEWKHFSPVSEEAINVAYGLKKAQVTITEDGENVIVYFSKMVCSITVSGEKASIRSGVKVGKDVFVWQWQDIQGEEHVYTPAQMLVLEDSFQSGDSPAVLKLGTRKYTVDFKAWTQTANTTKEMKILARVKLDVTIKAKSNARKQKIKAAKEKVETISYNGKRPVDSYCQKLHSSHVYYNGDEVWDVTLNQTNLQYNNNKFYKIQLLEDNNSNFYSVWLRWGRVGQRGQFKLTEYGYDLSSAKTLFEAKFKDKTKNNWSERDKFEKVQGKYDILYVEYSSNEDAGDAKTRPIPESNLDKRVKDLIELICNIKTMEEMVLEMKYDAKKAPLGKLTTDQIKAGYSSLKVIEGLINGNQLGPKLVEACNEFYTRIPHSFGMKSPPLIATLPMIKQKIQLLEALGDIQIAIKLLNENPDMLLHPADNHYKSLKCELIPLEKGSDNYTLIEKYLRNTHGATHNGYTLEIEDIFACVKDGDKDKFLDFGNRMLLWHGSRLTNWAGILGKGLRIAPPEAPISGYMFGKGLYFADMCSKSANYCFASHTVPSGLLLLCEVSLGDCNELKVADSNADRLPMGKHSVKGRGMIIPDPREIVELPDGVKVPCGKGLDSNFFSVDRYTLIYNEYIVYNVNQVRMRYLIRVKFNFKQ